MPTTIEVSSGVQGHLFRPPRLPEKAQRLLAQFGGARTRLARRSEMNHFTRRSGRSRRLGGRRIKPVDLLLELCEIILVALQLSAPFAHLSRHRDRLLDLSVGRAEVFGPLGMTIDAIRAGDLRGDRERDQFLGFPIQGAARIRNRHIFLKRQGGAGWGRDSRHERRQIFGLQA
jgi:hypothetical protein